MEKISIQSGIQEQFSPFSASSASQRYGFPVKQRDFNGGCLFSTG
jgi:hypothetical protein